MKSTILLIGGGGHCRACIDVLEQDGTYSIAGIVDKNKNNLKKPIMGYPYIGTDDDLPELVKKYKNALITVGQIRNYELRKKLYIMLKKLNFITPIIISPLSYVSPYARIGEGTIVMHNVLVNAGTEIGINCILNSKSLIEHDVSVGNHTHISTSSVLNGNVKIGSETFIGSGSIVRENIIIGSKCFIACGTKVLKIYLKNKILIQLK